MTALKVFIGWDSREVPAYDVCRASLLQHSSIPLEVQPIRQDELRRRGLYWRAPDPLAATEFSITRFLTPFLAEYSGWALFVDCDFLFRQDVAQLLQHCAPDKALLCVQHDYQPSEATKMDGQRQTVYPRKNWSSCMLINCAHEQVRALGPMQVNEASALHLHRLQWLDDAVIGALPLGWNYLEGWYTAADDPDPAAVHFTRGGPWFEQWRHVEYAAEWLAAAALLPQRDRAAGQTAHHATRAG